MPWWGWIVVGVVLLVAEMVAVDLEFYLVFLGISAAAVGLLGLVGVELPVWGQWLAFAVLSVFCLVTFRRKLYQKLRGGLAGFAEPLENETFQLGQDLGPGESCRAQHRGTTWTVKNVGNEPLAAGETVSIETTEGLVLRVRRQT